MVKATTVHRVVREAVKVCRRNGDTSNEAIIRLLRDATRLRPQQISGIKAQTHIAAPAQTHHKTHAKFNFTRLGKLRHDLGEKLGNALRWGRTKDAVAIRQQLAALK